MKWIDCRGGFVVYHPPPKRPFISSSSREGRWDQMVLRKKSNDGTPHTCEFVGMWKGWGVTIRTIDQMISGNTAVSWTKVYAKEFIINIPPPLTRQFD